MTFDDFLHALRQVKAVWRLDHNGSIRCTINGRVCCPITALGVEPLMYMYRRDAERLGMDIDLARVITYSADFGIGCPTMRAALMRATVDKPSPGAYEAGLKSSYILTTDDVRTYFRLWGGMFVDESRGVVLSPDGRFIHVQVSRMPLFGSEEEAIRFYNSDDAIGYKGDK